MNDRTAYSAWMLCLLAGGLAGASVALLLAPHSGKDTRARLRRRLREAGDSVHSAKERVIRRSRQLQAEAARRVGAASGALAGNGSGDGATSV